MYNIWKRRAAAGNYWAAVQLSKSDGYPEDQNKISKQPVAGFPQKIPKDQGPWMGNPFGSVIEHDEQIAPDGPLRWR